MKTEVKFLLIVLAILVILVVMFSGADVESLGEGYSALEIGFGLLFLSSFIWVPLVLVLFAPSMTR